MRTLFAVEGRYADDLGADNPPRRAAPGRGGITGEIRYWVKLIGIPLGGLGLLAFVVFVSPDVLDHALRAERGQGTMGQYVAVHSSCRRLHCTSEGVWNDGHGQVMPRVQMDGSQRLGQAIAIGFPDELWTTAYPAPYHVPITEWLFHAGTLAFGVLFLAYPLIITGRLRVGRPNRRVGER